MAVGWVEAAREAPMAGEANSPRKASAAAVAAVWAAAATAAVATEVEATVAVVKVAAMVVKVWSQAGDELTCGDSTR